MKTTSHGRRAAMYWFVDGLPEIVYGLTLIVLGSLVSVWHVYAAPKTQDWIVIAFVIALDYRLNHGVVDFLKSRLTYPRTGYVQPPEEEGQIGQTPRPRIISLLHEPPAKKNVTVFQKRTALPILGALFFTCNGNPLGRWLLPSVMTALAITLYALNRRSVRPYRWWSALMLAGTGMVFLWADAPESFREPVPLLLTGAWLLAEGVFSLVRYLRMNPYPQTAEGLRA